MTGREKIFSMLCVSRVAPRALSRLDETVATIHEAAERRNAAQGITGLLLIAGGWCVQALEGEQSAVQAAFADFRHDPRMLKCEILRMGMQPARLFGRWSMCARGLSPADTAVVDQIEKRKGFKPGALPPETLVALLRAVAQAQEGKAGPIPTLYL